jgi:hypothetical protein
MSQDRTTKTPDDAGPSARIKVYIQDRIAVAFDIHPADREAMVRAMLERSGRAPAGYWLSSSWRWASRRSGSFLVAPPS